MARHDAVRGRVHHLFHGDGGGRLVLKPSKTQVGSDGYLTALLYELLDAHGDTMLLADELDSAPGWAAHLDYLRDLQRVGREALAWREGATL
jgi:hypothetical protein